MAAYAGKQYVGIDLHRRRTVIVRTTEAGDVRETVRIVDVQRLASVMARVIVRKERPRPGAPWVNLVNKGAARLLALAVPGQESIHPFQQPPCDPDLDLERRPPETTLWP